MFVLKMAMLHSGWSELLCNTQPFKTIAEKYSSDDVSTILLTNQKIFTAVIPKTQRITNCSQLQQPRRKTSRQNACTHDQRVQTVTGGISRRVTSDRQNTSLNAIIDHEVKVIEGCYRKITPL